MTGSSTPEVWLRGPVPGIGAFLQPVAHSLLQCREEARTLLAGLAPDQLRRRPAGGASVTFHLRHAIGSLDRLLTYARGEALSAAQLATLAAEPAANDAATTGQQLSSAFDAAVTRALDQLRGVPQGSLLEPREVGRGRLPSTTIGLLFHAAEHTQRHLGQAATTAIIVRQRPAGAERRSVPSASGVTVTLEPDPSPADVAVVNAGLRAFNVARIGEPAEEPVHVFVRDATGVVAGGLLGHIRWRWLYVAKLWLAEDFRGAGLGTAMLEAAEGHARERGCIGVFLDTFEYQARPFYEKRGYAVFGTLDGYPPGYRQHHLAKRLGDD
jgi:GNAT superfamily N-acetyltransferase/uncharacterized damage-inducible protein DinB